MHDALGDRMKNCYEAPCNAELPKRMPQIIRCDGRAFTKWTYGLKKPYDRAFIDAMNDVAINLCEEIQGAQFAYLQSDEISIFVHNYKKYNSQPWFDNKTYKILSVSASIAAAKMTALSSKLFGYTKLAHFDSRAFILPESEVCNYFWWRQNDWIRNSVQMLARTLYSHRELHKKNSEELKIMCKEKDTDWNNFDDVYKYGRCIIKEYYEYPNREKYGPNIHFTLRSRWVVDENLPLFKNDRTYVERHLEVEEG